MTRLNSTHSAADLDRRSEMASRLKYGAVPRTATAAADRATNIPFPVGLAPVPTAIVPAPAPSDPLPGVDVIAMMDTAAESRAMADVLTPGVDVADWYPYAKDFTTKYLPLVGPMGPSRESKRLGSYYVTVINGLRVLVYKTELHMHEDAITLADGSMSLPIKAMLAQIIAEANPTVFLTTGTSGGVYPAMSLGDVVVSRAARFQCLRDFKDAPFNDTRYESHWTIPTAKLAEAERLMQGFARHLTGVAEPKGTPPNPKCGCSPSGKYPTRIHLDGTGTIPAFHPILTTDIFEFGTSVNRLDTLGMAVEMDDACLGLACRELAAPPKWACVRNLSDPTINGALAEAIQEQCAEYYYQKFGYWTTVMSALTTWGIVAGLTDNQLGEALMKPGSVAALVAAVLAAIAIVVQTVRLDSARHTIRAGDYEADSLVASRDTTRKLTLRVARLGDSLRITQRRAEQVDQHADALDRALRLERVARDSLTATIRDYHETVMQTESAGGEPIVAPRGTADTSSAAATDSLRVGSFDVRQPPYTIHAQVELPAPPARGALNLEVAVDTLEIALRLGCSYPNADGVRAAYASVTGPPWAAIHLARVEQAPEVCAKIPTPASRWAPVARVLDRVGFSVGYVAGLGSHNVGFVGPGAIVGIRLWP